MNKLGFVYIVYALLIIFGAAYVSNAGAVTISGGLLYNKLKYMGVTCYSYQGMPIRVQVRENLPKEFANEFAFAAVYKKVGRVGYPIIVMNNDNLKTTSKAFKLWVYYHECGHHALGHLHKKSNPRYPEIAADCYGYIRYIHRKKKRGITKLLKSIRDMYGANSIQEKILRKCF